VTRIHVYKKIFQGMSFISTEVSLIKQQVIKRYRGVEAQLHALISTLDEAKLSPLIFWSLITGKTSPLLVGQEAVWAQSRSGHAGEQKIHSSAGN
jgi:hypothetical protein